MSIDCGIHRPIAEVELVEPPRNGEAYSWLVLCCPFCGKPHIHGAGTDPREVDSFLGGRVPHCLNGGGNVREYQLVRREGVRA